MKRKIFIFFLILILMLTSFLDNSFARRANPVPLSSHSSYEAATVEWEQVVDNGFGNINNLHAWSMEEYKEFLYVGTRNVVDGCQVYRSETGDKDTWKQVNINGFSNESKSEGARHMIVYQNLLWVITISWDNGAQVWVTDGEDSDSDGILNWKKANLNGFGQGDNIIETRALAVYNDKLFVGAGTKDNHPLLFRYDGPTEYNNIDPVNWTLVKDWFDDPHYNPDLFLVGEMANFTGSDGNEYLYAIIITGVTPLNRWLHANFSFINIIQTLKIMFFTKSQIWRYNGELWQNVGKEVFQNTNMMGSTLRVFNGSLYIGTANFRGGEIWSTKDGIQWKQISKRGFNRPLNLWVWKLFSYKNRLVAGTFNPIQGCEVWISTNDSPTQQKDFIKISKHGMDGSNMFTAGQLPQDGARSFETFHGKLYTGTTNWVDLNTNFTGTGCEVWRINTLSNIKGK